MTVITRFAPSPTGFLHIGGARTALFNYLFAKHHGGKYLLRIEDTDRARSTQEAVDAILSGLSWLELTPDAEPTYQFGQADRHREVVHTLLKAGHAYYCYCSPEELTQMREEARANKQPVKYNGKWRDRPSTEPPEGVAPVVRLKAPQAGQNTIHDLVQGNVTVDNAQLDDFILLRADGSPTYMLSVVVDDHDMGITHIIRGDDHLTNGFRQKNLYEALGWQVPFFAHIPLIHGADGAKLSKRHGALGVDAYKDMGLLPEALCNYLLKLGWGHGDDEIISRVQAIEWFSTDGIGKAPARFDMQKLIHLNGHYIRNTPPPVLCDHIKALVERDLKSKLTDMQQTRLLSGMPGLQERAKDINELAHNAMVYLISRPLVIEESAQALIDKGNTLIPPAIDVLQALETWDHDALERTLRTLAETLDVKFGIVAQALRASLTGKKQSPGIFEVLEVFGKEESLARLKDVLA